MPRVRKSPEAAARQAKTGWEEAFDVWEEFQENGRDFARDHVHGPGLLRAIGNVDGLRTLDIGCGQGRFTRTLARRGARVSAVDWSDRMIASARQHERADPLGIDYRVADARTAANLWKPGSFDVIVACMSFMDMPGLPQVLRGAHRLLRPGGRLVFSVSHPLNTAETGWERPQSTDRGGMIVRDYFDEGIGETEWAMARLQRPFTTLYWHRTFGSWFSLLRTSGFDIESLAEPRASASQVRKIALLQGTREAPFFLVLGCRRRRSAPPGRRTGGTVRPRTRRSRAPRKAVK
ncbi:MAG: class I SAM-dependent methyltransferase [Thermoplasmata archaeon]|nr:class I SAM-dependent methyltransferase [Thermoplasmata archaeon]MCI4361887.1 class I SAM-dependent methyltransferase [Thermoplasmata archaeon]